jgi:hypothetical protein
MAESAAHRILLKSGNFPNGCDEPGSLSVLGGCQSKLSFELALEMTLSSIRLAS